MGKTVDELDPAAREDLESLSKCLQRSRTRSAVLLADLAEMAFEITFHGKHSEDKLAKALARGISVRERMALEEGGSESAEEAARRLNLTKQSVLNLYHAGKLLAWKIAKQGAFRFPVWQFVEGDRLPGVEAVLAIMNAAGILDDWGKIGFFLQTHSSLGDRRPLDLLRENKLDSVLRAARTYVQ